ncbi:MAG TPA: carboxypeptidase regulatory-like domain-containing protein, partial [Chromatiaceae bacterium]|nr:carboxypeptidase regulatory-like domain-containing protein [Chromatiaceae bacterium]
MYALRTFQFLIFSTLFIVSSALAGTTGTIRGTVTDAETDDALAGVTVIATSESLQGQEFTLSDDKGRYILTGLPPGTYKIQFIFAESTSQQSNVRVSIDKTTQLSRALLVTETNAEIYEIEEEAASIDVASSTLGVSVSKEMVQHLPMGRSRNYSQALDLATSADSDTYGTAFAGS